MINVAVLFGGRSAEHEVSLQSAINVVSSMDKTRFVPILIGIDKKGNWFLNGSSMHLLDTSSPKHIRLSENSQSVALVPNGESKRLLPLDGSCFPETFPGKIDVLFPVLHGPYGEDGTIQGLAKLADLPCVGAGVLGSAVGMDKDIMKRLLRDAGIPVAPYVPILRSNRDQWSYSAVCEYIALNQGEDMYVKPANMGSSVGISRVRNEEQFDKALSLAFTYDTKIIAEKGIKGRELECAVLGNDFPRASGIGEVIPADGFYSYDAKYIDENGAILKIPADLTSDEVLRLKEAAIATFRTLCCKGFGRVDMFLTPDGEICVNEINTIPGFTNISMYPKLWEQEGLLQKNLVSTLIDLAIEDFESLRSLKVDA